MFRPWSKAFGWPYRYPVNGRRKVERDFVSAVSIASELTDDDLAKWVDKAIAGRFKVYFVSIISSTPADRLTLLFGWLCRWALLGFFGASEHGIRECIDGFVPFCLRNVGEPDTWNLQPSYPTSRKRRASGSISPQNSSRRNIELIGYVWTFILHSNVVAPFEVNERDDNVCVTGLNMSVAFF